MFAGLGNILGELGSEGPGTNKNWDCSARDGW